MKPLFPLFIAAVLAVAGCSSSKRIAEDRSQAATVNHVQIPMVRGDNLVMSIALPAGIVDELQLDVKGLDTQVLESAYLYAGETVLATAEPGPKGKVVFKNVEQGGGVNVAIRLGGNLDLYSPVAISVSKIKVGGKKLTVVDEDNALHHGALVIRTFGDDGVNSYRIPGLVTTKKGTLVGSFDIRRRNSADLQGDIDVGVMRSTDGGRTWGPMIVAMDMGEYGGLGQEFNGIGDPCILVDEVTGDLLLFAAWVNGDIGTAWWNAKDGFEIGCTPQLMMARSTDDGLTWSEPENLTRQIKQEAWNFTFQGPGRGITMADGTLVVPFQHQEPDRTPAAGIMYSMDRGKTWNVYNYAKINTTESQVAEIAPGKLLLAIRDNRGKARAMYVTENLGKTWDPYDCDGVLPDPVCMGSIIHVNAADNALGRDLVLFSNPASPSDRNNITIRASFDGGKTWPSSVLLDEGYGWGYSCLTMVDKSHVGILYESSVGNMTFQVVDISELLP